MLEVGQRLVVYVFHPWGEQSARPQYADCLLHLGDLSWPPHPDIVAITIKSQALEFHYPQIFSAFSVNVPKGPCYKEEIKNEHERIRRISVEGRARDCWKPDLREQAGRPTLRGKGHLHHRRQDGCTRIPDTPHKARP